LTTAGNEKKNYCVTPKIAIIVPVFFVVLLALYQHDAVGAESGFSIESYRLTADTDSLVINAPDSMDKNDDDLKSKIVYHAKDSIVGELNEEVVHLYRDATVDYEDLHLKAGYIRMEMNKKELYAEGIKDSAGNIIGRPEFSQGAQQFRASTIRYNFGTKKGKIGYVITQEGEGYIHGEVVKKDPENNFFIRNGQYTTCENDTPHYAIGSRRLKVISNNKVVTGPAYLIIEEIPTPLFIPFGFFPNRKGRSSGVIIPSFGESAERGFFFQHIGYYFGISDQFTTAVTGDVYTKGSYTVDMSSLYANRYHYNGNFKLSYSKAITSEKELPDYEVRKDYYLTWVHTQDPKARPYSNFGANVNIVTSSYFRNTISSPTNFLSNTFNSAITYQKTFPDKPFNLGLSMNHTQNTVTHRMRITLPDLSFGVSRITPFKRKLQVGAPKWYQKIGASYSLRGTNFVDGADSTFFKKESLDSMQNGVLHTIPVSTSLNLLKYFALTPSVTYTERWYTQTVRYVWNADSAKKDTIRVKGFSAARDYILSAGLSTRMYGMYQFTRGKIVAIRHVMNPSVSYSYRPDYSKVDGYYRRVQADTTGRMQQYSIYQTNVYGAPPSGKYGNISFGLDNNVEMKVKAESDTGATLKKIKILESLRIGGNYNLAADSMKLSVFQVSGRTTLFDKVGLNFSGTLDPYAFDSLNTDYNKYQYKVNKQLVRLTSANLSVNFSLAPKSNGASTSAPPKGKRPNEKYSKEELDYINQHPEDYVDFNLPYNLSVGYTYSYNKRGDASPTQMQSASANGDLSITPKWKVGFNSWYDFTAKRFTNFGLNIYRDLHCWEMRLNWVPFGAQESYFFQINVKAAILQDLKLLKRRDFYDR
jgi:hypothetical protein